LAAIAVGLVIIGGFLLWVVLMIAVASEPAHGAERYLTIATVSHHFQGSGYCETNPGLGIEYPLSRHTYASAGGYRNSYCDPTAYVGLGYETRAFKWLSAGGEAWIVNGYGDHLPFPAAAAIFFTIGPPELNLKIIRVPVDKAPDGRIRFGFKYGFAAAQVRIRF